MPLRNPAHQKNLMSHLNLALPRGRGLPMPKPSNDRTQIDPVLLQEVGQLALLPRLKPSNVRTLMHPPRQARQAFGAHPRAKLVNIENLSCKRTLHFLNLKKTHG